MTTPLYDVFLTRPNEPKRKRLGVVKAEKAPGPTGTWFPKTGDIMRPETEALKACLPNRLQHLLGNGCLWFVNDTLYCRTSLMNKAGKVLATVHCEGYERESLFMTR